MEKHGFEHLPIASNIILKHLEEKEKGTCLLVTGLAKVDCEDLSKKIMDDFLRENNKYELKCCVVSDDTTKAKTINTVTSTKIVEYRNLTIEDDPPDLLVVLKPHRSISDADDSFDNNNFLQLSADLIWEEALLVIKDDITKEIEDENIVRNLWHLLSNSPLSKNSTLKQIEFIIRIRDQSDFIQSTCDNLFVLGLFPDQSLTLDSDPNDFRTRLKKQLDFFKVFPKGQSKTTEDVLKSQFTATNNPSFIKVNNYLDNKNRYRLNLDISKTPPNDIDFSEIAPLLGRRRKITFDWSPRPKKITPKFDISWVRRPKREGKKVCIEIATIEDGLDINKEILFLGDPNKNVARIDCEKYLYKNRSDMYRLYLSLLDRDDEVIAQVEADVREEEDIDEEENFDDKDGHQSSTYIESDTYTSVISALIEFLKRAEGKIEEIEIDELQVNGITVNISAKSSDQKQSFKIDINETMWKYEQIVIQNPSYIGPYEVPKEWIQDPAMPVKPTRQISMNEGDIKKAMKRLGTNLPSLYQKFVKSRKKLFMILEDRPLESISLTQDNRSKNNRPSLIDKYTTAYQKLINSLKDTIFQMSGNDIIAAKSVLQYLLSCDALFVYDGESTVILLPPTNPIRLQWMKEVESETINLIPLLDAGIIETEKSTTIPSLENIQWSGILGSIVPSVMWGPTERDTSNVCLFRGTINGVWAIFSTPRGTAPFLAQDIIGHLGNIVQDEIGPNDSRLIRRRISRYLSIYPFIDTLIINVINAGPGNTLAEALLQLHPKYHAKKFRINFLIDSKSNTDQSGMYGKAFDELMKNPYRSERTIELIGESDNSLLPGLRYSKKVVNLSNKDEIPPAHISILFDVFSDKVELAVLDEDRFIVSSLGAGTMVNFDSKYTEGTVNVWERVVKHGTPSKGINQTQHNHHLCVSKCSSPEIGDGKVIGTRILVPKKDSKVLTEIYSRSDWVILVDQYIGIELLDRVTESDSRYLIDYAPEFQEERGYRVITSTVSTEALDLEMTKHLETYSWYDNSFLSAITDALNSLSGILLMKYVESRTLSVETTTIALLMLCLKHWNNQNQTKVVVIPLDAYQDIWFKSDKRPDLLLVCITPNGQIGFTIIEIKCENSENPILSQMSRAETQLRSGYDILCNRFNIPQNDLIKEITRTELFGVIRFHIEKLMRFGHDMIPTGKTQLEFLKSIKNQLIQRDYNVDFDLVRSYFVPKAIYDKEVEINDEGDIKTVYVDGTYCEKIVANSVVDSTRLIERLLGPTCASSIETEKFPLVDEESEDRILDELLEEELEAPIPDSDIEEVQEKVDDSSIHETSQKDEFNEILIGNWKKRKISWSPHDSASPHLIIVGMTGAGKTQTMKSIIDGLEKNQVHSLIFDFNDEYIDDSFAKQIDCEILDPSKGLDLNPLSVGDNPTITAYEVAGIIARVYELGVQQEKLLRDAIKQAFKGKKKTPPFGKIGEILRNWSTETKHPKKNIATTLLGRIEALFDFGIFGGHTRDLLERIFERSHVIRLQTLKADPKDALKNAVVELVLNHLKQEMYSRGHSDMSIYCMVDEAHRLTYKDSPIPQLVREARKYGVGVILSSQMVKDFDDEVLSNIGATIAFKVSSEDAKRIAKSMTSNRSQQLDIVETLLSLKIFEAIVRTGKFPDPIKVKVVPFFKRYME